MAGDDDGPEDRNNWNAILKWSLAQTDPAPPAAAPREKLTEEDRKWVGLFVWLWLSPPLAGGCQIGYVGPIPACHQSVSSTVRATY
jgi:hypothetical protein